MDLLAKCEDTDQTIWYLRGKVMNELGRRIRVLPERAPKGERITDMVKRASQATGRSVARLFEDMKICDTFAEFAVSAASAPVSSDEDVRAVQSQLHRQDLRGAGRAVDGFFDASDPAPQIEDIPESASPGSLGMLPREYYVVALRAPEGKRQAAIEYAHSRRGEPGYTAEQFRDYVETLKEDAASGRTSTPKEDTWYVRIPLDPAQSKAIRASCNQFDLSPVDLMLGYIEQGILLGKPYQESFREQCRLEGRDPSERIEGIIARGEAIKAKNGQMAATLPENKPKIGL
jgi:hypothetical protein